MVLADGIVSPFAAADLRVAAMYEPSDAKPEEVRCLVGYKVLRD